MHAKKIDGSEEDHLAINEISILRSGSQAAKLEILVDNLVRLEELVCDGALVSTPAGSTAYNYSAPVAYSSAKAALNTYVSSVSRKLIKDQVVMACVCPGPIELPNRYMTISQKKNNSFWKNFKKNHLPIGRMAKPDEITSVIYFLTSKVASYCSGAIWNVDGSEY